MAAVILQKIGKRKIVKPDVPRVRSFMAQQLGNASLTQRDKGMVSPKIKP